MAVEEQKEFAETEEDQAVRALRELEEENRRLREENERLASLSPKERLYDRIPLSLKAMDRIIAALCVLFVLVVIMGIMK